MLIGLLIWLSCIVIAGNLARWKRRDVGLWAFLALLFGPFAPVILAGLSEQQSRKCTRCRKSIPIDAEHCGYCGTPQSEAAAAQVRAKAGPPPAHCPSCGASGIAPDFEYCPSCGAALAPTEKP